MSTFTISAASAANFVLAQNPGLIGAAVALSNQVDA